MAKKILKKPVRKSRVKVVKKHAIVIPHRGVNPTDVLRAGAQHMDDRSVQYDQPQGERSMEKTVKMFNVLTGHNLSETEGWKFMELLKMVRSSTGPFKLDNYEDRVAYCALAAEAHSQEK